MTLEKDTDTLDNEDLLRLSSEVVASYVASNTVNAGSLPELIRSVHQSLANLGKAEAARPTEKQKPAVPINRSVADDYIVCLEDGKRLKMLKRYLRSKFNLSARTSTGAAGACRRNIRWWRRPMRPVARPSPRRSALAEACGGRADLRPL